MNLKVACQVKDLSQKLHVYPTDYGATRVFSRFVPQWSFTTQLTNMWLLLFMNKFMSLQVINESIKFTTVLTDIFLFPLWINSCIFKSPALVKDLPLKMQTFNFSQLWINLCFIMWPKMSLFPTWVYVSHVALLSTFSARIKTMPNIMENMEGVHVRGHHESFVARNTK